MKGSTSTDFRSHAYQRYSSNSLVDYARLSAYYERLLAPHLALESTWRCLDLACGYGNFLAYLRARGVSEFIGIDLTEAAILRAEKEFGKERVACCDALDYLDQHEQGFELISALDFVEHLQPDELLRLSAGVWNSLSKEGLFLLRTPNATAPFGMAARYNDITHETCFTAGALGDVMERVGFDVLGIWEDVAMPGNFRQLLHYAAWQCLRFVYRLMDAIETGGKGSEVMTRNFWMLLRKHERGVNG